MVSVGGSKAAFLVLQPQTVTGDGGIRPLIGAESRRVNGTREAFIYLTINDQDYIQIERALSSSATAIKLYSLNGRILLSGVAIDLYADTIERDNALWDERTWHSVSLFFNLRTSTA